MFSSLVSSDSNHFTLIRRARPGSISCAVTFLGAINALLIMKATPALACGESGSAENTISIFWP